MRRIAIAAVLSLGLAAAIPRAQDWRAANLAAFDDVWQTIQDTFYDPTFGGIDWRAVRDELRPRAEAAKSPDETRVVIREMLARLKKSHFALLSATSASEALPGSLRVPIDIRVLDAATAGSRDAGSGLAGLAVVITRVWPQAGDASGLRAGQAIASVDGHSVAEIVGSLEGLTARAARVEIWRRVFRALHGEEGSTAALRVRDVGGVEREVKVARVSGAGEIVALGNLPPLEVQFSAEDRRTSRGRRVMVIGFTLWMAQVADRVADAVDRARTADGIVIDLRGNPGGLALMMNGVAGHFFADPVVLGTMHTRQARLEFKANPQLSTRDGRRVQPFAGRVAILVDELTASASETFAGAMQSLGRSRIFGTQTMGQALPASTRRLPNGDVLLHALGDFITSNGRSVEGDGVIPDEPVPLTRAALAAGRDPALEAALAWVDRSLLPPPEVVAMLQTPARLALPSASWVISDPE